MSEDVERVARAIYRASYVHCCGEEPEEDDESWRGYEEEARAAIAALQS